MMKFNLLFLAAAASVGQLGASVFVGQTQTFDDPDHHWVVGAGPSLGSPTPVPTAFGGPGGASDPYLSIVSTGTTGPKSRPSAQNFTEWAGDYVSAGVSRIRMDVSNFGTTDLSLRLLFIQFADPITPVSGAFSTIAIPVSAGSGWQTIEFDVSPAALTGLAAPGFIVDPAMTLAHAGEMRIFHNPDPFFAPGSMPAIAADLGVDNVTAAAVPEPATMTLTGAGLLMAGLLARRIRAR